MTQSFTVSSSHKYRTSYYTRYLLQAGGLSFSGLFLISLTIFVLIIEPPSFFDWKMALGLGGVGLICWVMAILGPFSESRTSLVTSPQGIEYQGFGFRVVTSWENIERLDVISPSQYALAPNQITIAKAIREQAPLLEKLERQYPENYRECLVLRKPIRYQKSPWAKWLIRNETQFIPLTEFLWWRNGDLGQDIQRYAPHLLKSAQG